MFAIENPWQGKPPKRISKSSGISELGIFVISPRTIWFPILVFTFLGNFQTSTKVGTLYPLFIAEIL